MTNKRFNKPTVKLRKKDARIYAHLDKNSYDYEIFLLERTIKSRNRVLDSLKVLNNNKVIVIDYIGDNNGRVFELSYVFFKDKILELAYKSPEENECYVKDVSNKDFSRNYLKYFVDVHKHFDKENFEDIEKKIDFGGFVYFNVTMSLNNKVAFFTITTDSIGNHVNRIK